ncbi:signal peptide peptidase SppA [Roseibium denhamense]|uniref:Protease-4 n=1 Tax=Roseibium denhamense TaxID=76305 RepID=A0ABY1PKQ4_9HYPH|nr:signal peptide peptidase SppA [Roseibium denhamense]MTI05896.1 signal peptide peptidase SppA [Roseibium denhamense]SMP35686.1 protease-4 [Roseibium denhamense]
MSVDVEGLLDRRRLRRKVTFWRILTFVVVAAGLIGALIYVAGAPGLSKRSAHIARIPIEGMILDNRKTLRMIERMGKSTAVKGVIISINSPGGSTTGGEGLYQALRELSEKKPVVAEIRTIGTSAGYMIALAADHIVARYNTITGSIGVLFQFGNIQQLLDTVGVKMEAIKSAPLKAEPDFYSQTTPEARAMLQTLVSDSYDWFVALVAERRQLEPAKAKELADGRILTGHRAQEEKLVDAIGGEDAAIKWLVEEKGVTKDLPVVTWTVNENIDDLPFAARVSREFGKGIGTALLGPMNDAKGLIPRGLTLDGLVSVWQAPEAADNKP